MTLRAELLADRGAASETPDFFRSRRFLDAEGVTHSVLVHANGASVGFPVIVRGIAGSDRLDAISPYGYPGGASGPAAAAPPPPPSAVDWSGTGLVSIFIRERIGGSPALAGATRRSVVQVHDPAQSRRLRSRFAEQIRRNERLGYSVELRRGPEASGEERAAFVAAYTETMRRAEAAERYFFDASYFEVILGDERTWLLLARTPDGTPAAGAVAALSDALLHYYLGGTADAYLGESPFKNVINSMVELAEELGVPLNLGGGVRSGDGLEEFKRGFANAELPFHTHEIVCDADTYAALSGGREDTGFFPLYRSGLG